MPKDIGYRWEDITLPSGEPAIRVFDIEVMSMLTPDERPEFMLAEAIDGKFFNDVVSLFDQKEAKGKSTHLLLRHNKPNEEAEVIGRLERLRWEEPWLMTDAVVTNPEAIAKLKRGELPCRSAEFDPDRWR